MDLPISRGICYFLSSLILDKESRIVLSFLYVKTDPLHLFGVEFYLKTSNRSSNLNPLHKYIQTHTIFYRLFK